MDNARRQPYPGHDLGVALTPIADWQRWWRDAAVADPLASVASAQGFVLSTTELARLGVSRGRARWAVEQGRWTRAAHGLVAPVDVRRDPPEVGDGFVLTRRRHALAATGAALLRRGEAVTGRSAAVLHGLPTFSLPPTPELTSRTEGSLGRRSTTHLYAATLDRWQMTQWFGVDLSDVARTLADLGRHDARDAIMAADAALREQIVSEAEIERALTLSSGWPGVRRAREVLALADPRAESPLESLTRLALHDDRFPVPELQVWIGSDRVDFYWPAFGVVLEADGRVKYTSDERWAEKKREQRLRRHVRRVERVTWSDVTTDWVTTSQILRSALR